MKFGQFSTREAGSEGRLWHLRHLQTKELLFEHVEQDGTTVAEPVGIVLRSTSSPEVRQAVLENQRAKAQGGGKDKDLAVAQALVVRFQHIQRDDGRPLEPTKEDLDWFFGLDPSYVTGAMRFADDPGNFINAD